MKNALLALDSTSFRSPSPSISLSSTGRAPTPDICGSLSTGASKEDEIDEDDYDLLPGLTVQQFELQNGQMQTTGNAGDVQCQGLLRLKPIAHGHRHEVYMVSNTFMSSKKLIR